MNEVARTIEEAWTNEAARTIEEARTNESAQTIEEVREMATEWPVSVREVIDLEV